MNASAPIESDIADVAQVLLQKNISWSEVSKTNPCPLCGKSDWCCISENGEAVVCGRTDTVPMGWKFIKYAKDDRPIYARDKSITPPRHHVTIKKPAVHTLPIPEAKLLTLSAPVSDSPQPTQLLYPVKGVPPHATEIVYYYSQNQWVTRYDWLDPSHDKGRDKTCRQWHRGEDGTPCMKKGKDPWLAYRLEEVLSAIEATHQTSAVLLQEGEKVVEIARANGLASITFSGSSWSHESIEPSLHLIKDSGPGTLIVFLHDTDTVGLKKAKTVAECCAKVGLPCLLVNPHQICPQLENDTDDLEQILEHMAIQEFTEKLEAEIQADREQSTPPVSPERSQFFESEEPEKSNNTKKIPEFTQVAFNTLYSDRPWICVSNKLYQWTDTYYEHSPDDVEIRRIAEFCDRYAVARQDGRIHFPYANAASVEKVLKWVKMRLTVDPRLVNPAGLNCTNGVLQLLWDGDVPSWILVDHNPDFYYIYPPIATYKPDADPIHCDRLLEALEPAQRDIFLKTIAASLDLTTVRKFKGRAVRALLLKGDGSNGKDSLREVVSMMYGRQGMTACTLTDFAAYDTGRKFPLSKLIRSRVNWASENANTSRIDKIQCLKTFITGEELESERKGVDAQEFFPTGIAIFNVNDTPNLQGSQEAIASRYGILEFNKTFKIGANPKLGELEADPRFKYDPIFLANRVVPAFLNRVLQALVDLMKDGIDYRCTLETLESIQAENCHLFGFCKEVGLAYDPNSTVTAGEIWTVLERWYQDNGTLSYEQTNSGKQKAIWSDQVKPSDKNVKAVNQVIARFLQLFPKAKRVTVAKEGWGKPLQAISGIGFFSSDLSQTNKDLHPTTQELHPSTSEFSTQKTLEDRGSSPTSPNFSDSGEANQLRDSNDLTSHTEVNTDKILTQVSEVDESSDSTNDSQVLDEVEIGCSELQPSTELISEWMSEENLQSMTDDLEGCEDIEMFRLIKEVYHAEALKVAEGRISLGKQKQISLWVAQLDG
ncbi:hypothetical protein F7734_04710 [Scytonema sp. UIC 10036]|uniref:DUF5906 domain-containing protein n=1 Tax=Scytonema sp. UIC 10036 TaxID=2304196 RepID=UPI0012DAEEB8|nr:DUF5906 domain-containing protein [Scytonema sp. UIC 10036]MUG91809.1 hypothetical protein [Scytonema sp. UIC 10036]